MVITNAASGKLFDAKMGDSLVAEHVDLPEIPRRALLTFTLDETPKALNLQVMYQEMRFEAGVMRRVLEDLQSTLEHCAAAPDAVATNGPVLNFNSENMQRASARMDEFTIFSPNMLPYPVRSRPDHNITATGTPGKAIWEV